MLYEVITILGLSIFVASILVAWGWMEYDEFVNTPLALPEEGMTYELKPGATVRSVAQELAQDQVLSKPVLLRLV